MHLLRFHYRKLFLFALVIVTVALLVLSQITHSSKGSLKEVLRRQDHKLAPHISPVRAAPAKGALKVDVPHLAQRHASSRDQAARLGHLLLNLTQESRCPICLGNDLCEDISSAFLSLTSDIAHVDQATNGVFYSGNIGIEHSVRVQVVNDSAMRHVERVLCGEALPCGVKAAAERWPYVTSVEALSPALLVRFLSAVRSPPSSHPVLICPSTLSMSVLEAAFASDPVSAGSGVPTPAEKLHLLTALATAPSLALQKMTEQVQLSSASPSALGACGQAWVGGRDRLKPLPEMLEEPWEVRAALGAQLLALQQDMLESSEEWLVFVRRWSPELLAVTGEGELLLLDPSHAALIDKGTLTQGSAGAYGEEDDFDTLGETCNKDCFRRRVTKLFARLPSGGPPLDSPLAPREVNTVAGKPSRDKTILSNIQRSGRSLTAVAEAAAPECAHEDLFAHIMYASACAFVLSDDETHRRVDYFPVFSGQRHSTEQYRGLLHSPPETSQAQLEALLASCVEERTPGDRLRSADQLKDLLAEQGGLPPEDDDDEDDVDYEDDDEEDVLVEQKKGAGAKTIVDHPHAIEARIREFEKEGEARAARTHSRGL